jgi:hypothetical protein
MQHIVALLIASGDPSSRHRLSPRAVKPSFPITFSIGGVSFHPAPTGVRVVYAEGHAASFIPAPDPQLSVIARPGRPHSALQLRVTILREYLDQTPFRNQGDLESQARPLQSLLQPTSLPHQTGRNHAPSVSWRFCAYNRKHAPMPLARLPQRPLSDPGGRSSCISQRPRSCVGAVTAGQPFSNIDPGVGGAAGIVAASGTAVAG